MCMWDKNEEDTSQNCYHKRNCVTLDGDYTCKKGVCSRLKKGWTCKRKCEHVPIEKKNLLIIAGDDLLTAYCRTAINTRNNKELWRDHNKKNNKILTISCTMLGPLETDFVRVTDCINGSFIPTSKFGNFANLTTITKIYEEEGLTERFDENKMMTEEARETYLPFDSDIMIYPKSLLYINHEGCVNTLQHECKKFYDLHGKDGRNQTSASRFPCFYSANNSKFVVRRFNLIKTKYIFLLFFCVPSMILILSCLMLFLCSKSVAVTREGAMAMISGCWSYSELNVQTYSQTKKEQSF